MSRSRRCALGLESLHDGVAGRSRSGIDAERTFTIRCLTPSRHLTDAFTIQCLTPHGRLTPDGRPLSVHDSLPDTERTGHFGPDAVRAHARVQRRPSAGRRPRRHHVADRKRSARRSKALAAICSLRGPNSKRTTKIRVGTRKPRPVEEHPGRDAVNRPSMFAPFTLALAPAWEHSNHRDRVHDSLPDTSAAPERSFMTSGLHGRLSRQFGRPLLPPPLFTAATSAASVPRIVVADLFAGRSSRGTAG